MTLTTKISLVLGILLLIFVILPFGAMYFIQGRIVFPAPEVVLPVGPIGGFERVSLATPDGEVLEAWYHPPEPGQASLMVFHGNADAALYQFDRGEKLVGAGYGVLLVEYRGYGGSSGTPTEKGLITDGLTSYDFLRKETDGPIGILAHSLGTAVAIPVAIQREVFALVLESPMTSILDVARYRVSWLPMEPLFRYPFRSDEKIGRITAPILILHGTDDRVIPFRFGERMAALAPPGTEFVVLEGAGHNDLDRYNTTDRAAGFFAIALASGG